MFNAAVLPLCVFSDGDQVDLVIGGLETLNGLARPHIGIQTKCSVDRRREGQTSRKRKGMLVDTDIFI